MIPRNVRFFRVKPPSIGGLTRLQRFCGDRRSSPLNHQTETEADSRRILELEIQNARLQQLVAELLMENQQLRLKRQLVAKQP
jgi:hypothetical protein